MALTISIGLEEGGDVYDMHPTNSVPLGFLREQRSYALNVRYDGKRAPSDWELSINDCAVERVIKGGEEYFRFQTDFYAGDVRITLTSHRKILFDHQFVIDPDRFKLTRSDYGVMIADIRRATLALYRFSNVTLPATTAASAKRATLITLELIRAHFAQFEAAVSRIARQPATLLTASRNKVDLLSARRLESQNLVRALRSKTLRKATKSEANAARKFVAATKGHWVQKVEQSRRVENFDIYEHRAILGFIIWMEKILTNVLHASDPQEGELPLALRHRVENWRARLKRVRNSALLRSVIPETTFKATTRFRMHPDYANAFTAMSAIRSGLGDGNGIVAAVPIDRTYALYELWCYVNLLKAASEYAPTSKLSISKILRGVDDPSKLGVILARGDASRIDLGGGRSLTYQRRFSPTPDSEGAHTYVLEAIPDMCISVRDDNDRCTALAIFDPKYRVGSSLLDGLRDLHVYRDAIVRDDQRLVRYAVALTPGFTTLDCGAGPLPHDRPTAVRLRPGHDTGQFSALLSAGMAL